MNSPAPGADAPRPWPDAPADTFAGIGYRGQFLFVIPSLDLVIVRFAEDRGPGFGINRFLKLAIAGAASGRTAPAADLPPPLPERPAARTSAPFPSPAVRAVFLGFTAKEMCSCLFIVEQKDAFCRAFVDQPQHPRPHIEVETAARSVSAAVEGITHRARFSASHGCRLDSVARVP